MPASAVSRLREIAADASFIWVVVNLDNRELEVVHLEGRLDRIFAQQMADKPDSLAFLSDS